MMKKISLLALFLLCACSQSSGTPYPEFASRAQKISPTGSRLYIYRSDSIIGGAIQPSVYLDGAKVGDAVPGSFIVTDMAPGKHVVSATTERETRYAFSVKPGEEFYLKTGMTMGIFLGRIDFNMATPEQAQEDMKGLLMQSPQK